MSNTIPTDNIRNYLMYQDRDTLVNLVMNYIAKNNVNATSDNTDELEREYDNLEVEDAIALLWDDIEFNSSVEKAITHARNLKLKDNSPIGELLRKLSYKATIEYKR